MNRPICPPMSPEQEKQNKTEQIKMWWIKKHKKVPKRHQAVGKGLIPLTNSVLVSHANGNDVLWDCGFMLSLLHCALPSSFSIFNSMSLGLSTYCIGGSLVSKVYSALLLLSVCLCVSF